MKITLKGNSGEFRTIEIENIKGQVSICVELDTSVLALMDAYYFAKDIEAKYVDNDTEHGTIWIEGIAPERVAFIEL